MHDPIDKKKPTRNGKTKEDTRVSFFNCETAVRHLTLKNTRTRAYTTKATTHASHPRRLIV